MDTKRIINSHSTRGINTDDMCRICGSKNRRFIALFRSDGTSCDITDYICCYLGISVEKSDGMPQKICSDCKATLLSFHELYICCQETREKLLHMIKSKTKEPDKKTNVTAPPSGKGNSFFSEDDENDNLFDGNVLNDIEKALAKDDDDAQHRNSIKPKQTEVDKSQTMEKSAPKKSIEEQQNAAGSPSTRVNAWKNCKFCPKKFLTKAKLTNHIKDMHNELIFHCEVCEEYIARQDLITHMTHHALLSAGVPASAIPASLLLPSETSTPSATTASLSKTPVSQESTPTKEDRATVSNSSSKENQSPKKPKTVNHQCQLCNKQFADRTGLRYHTKHFHEKIKNFHCDMCDKRFSCKRIILNHIRGVHIKEKRYQCDQCPKVFKVDSALYMHKKSHDDKYLYFCKECDGKFKSRTQLNVHLTMHTKEKNFFCTLCNKGFAIRNNLTKHLRTHSSSFDFKCHICNYAANQRRYLQEHMKRAHQTVLPVTNC